MRREKWSSPLHLSCDVASRFLGFVLKVLGVMQAQYLFATSFIFSKLLGKVPDFELRFPLMTSFVNLHHFSVLFGSYVCFK